jgi:hypothetical protein
MHTSGGTLTLDGRDTPITQADCTLFVGRLDIDFELQDGDGACRNIPCGDVVEFAELSGRTISTVDCRNTHFENDVFRPTFVLHGDCYTIMSLHINSLTLLPDRNLLSFVVNLVASSAEDNAEMSVSIQGAAECNRLTATELLSRQEPIPIRFARHYLPLLGLPEIPEGTDRAQVVSMFGKPDDEGGGIHPKFGNIPKWIRYTLPMCFLRFEFDSDTVTQVTLMPKTGPFAS